MLRLRGGAHGRFPHRPSPPLHLLPPLPHTALPPPPQPPLRPPRLHPGLTVNTYRARAVVTKSQAGEFQYGAAGGGTFPRLAGGLFKITADVDILHIPFRGAGPALIDVVGGHTKVAFGSVTSSAV